jgi:hypothetical protein
MIVVDLFLLHQECTGGGMKQIEYYQALLSALIENHYEIGVVLQHLAEKQRRNALGRPGLEGTSGLGLHITLTKPVIEQASTEKKKHLQSQCKLCGLKTVYVCNYCRLHPNFGESGAAFCNPITGQTCYTTHMNQEH